MALCRAVLARVLLHSSMGMTKTRAAKSRDLISRLRNLACPYLSHLSWTSFLISVLETISCRPYATSVSRRLAPRPGWRSASSG